MQPAGGLWTFKYEFLFSYAFFFSWVTTSTVDSAIIFGGWALFYNTIAEQSFLRSLGSLYSCYQYYTVLV
jgi:hypothetical protein